MSRYISTDAVCPAVFVIFVQDETCGSPYTAAGRSPVAVSMEKVPGPFNCQPITCSLVGTVEVLIIFTKSLTVNAEEGGDVKLKTGP